MLAQSEASELCQHFNVACCGPWVSQWLVLHAWCSMYRDHCWQTLLVASDIENVVILGGDIENVGTFRGLKAVSALWCCMLWTLGVPMTCSTCLMLKVQKTMLADPTLSIRYWECCNFGRRYWECWHFSRPQSCASILMLHVVDPGCPNDLFYMPDAQCTEIIAGRPYF